MQQLQPNTTLQGGKYRIERVLGQGGFGITYLAEQTSLQRKVAIKEFFMKDLCSRDKATCMMSAPSTGSSKLVEQYRKKFIKEARNLAKLNHPNIISVIDVFEENGTVYYTMPYLVGGSLLDYVKAHGTLSESMAMKYVKQIAGALKYMHEEQHICHFDVKPANILLDDKGNAVLIDFGISKNYDSAGLETTTTPVGISEGYAPIEQYQQNVEEFSPISDVYALGATLYFLLHGKRPVSAVHRAGGTALLMSKKLSQRIKDIINASMKISKRERAKSVDVFMGNVSTSTYRKSTVVQDDDESTILEVSQRTQRTNSTYKQSHVSSSSRNTTVTDSNSNSMMGWIIGIAMVVIIALIIWLFSDNSSQTIPPPSMTTDSIEEIADIAPEDASSIRMEGNDYYYGWNGKSVNYTKAVELYQKAANMDDAEAQYNLGNAYESGVGIEKDYKESVKWYRKSANQGNVSAQSHLGAIYKFGEVGVVQNYDEALKWLRMAANKDDVMAQVLLGDMYNFGEGVEVDYTEAVRWYNKAALQGNSHAQSHLGLKYSNGQGVMKDATEAVKWFRKAAEQGNADAQRHLGYAYYKGEGVDKNYTEAYKWLKKAADKNDSWALYYLGYMYLYAEGVQQDFDEAYLMFKRSADLGHKDSQGMLKSRDYWPTMFNLNK